MNTKLKWLNTDLTSDDERVNSFRADFLKTIIIVTFVTTTAYLLALLILMPVDEIKSEAAFLGAAIFIVVLFYLLIQKRLVRLTSIMFAMFAWSLLTGAAITAGGTNAPAYFTYIVPLFITAVLFGTQGALVTFILIILTQFAIYYGEVNQLLKAQWIEHTSRTRWILGSIFFTVSASLVTITSSRLQSAFLQLRKEIDRRMRSEENVKQLNQDLIQAYESTMEGWAQALEMRDKETMGHSRRVTELSVKLAKTLGLDDDAIRFIYYGALLHDIGKMGISDEILYKPSPLSQEEWEIIHQHPIYAFELLMDIEYLQPALAIPYSHHENWDGTGYPQGLSGEEIPLPARIFAIVDNWDALSTDRPYRNAWSRNQIIE